MRIKPYPNNRCEMLSQTSILDRTAAVMRALVLGGGGTWEPGLLFPSLSVKENGTCQCGAEQPDH